MASAQDSDCQTARLSVSVSPAPCRNLPLTPEAQTLHPPCKWDDFTWKQWGGKKVDMKDYSSKKLEIAVQDMKITAEQRSGIEMVKAYAKEKGIEVIITVVK